MRLPKILYERYVIFILWSIISGLFGMAAGYYINYVEYNSSFMSGELVRPFLEYLIYLFYFIYFVILPFYLIYTYKAVEYFFSVFKITFFVSFFIGWVDYLSIYFFEVHLLTRHLNSDKFVGFRFHGLAGEPRDAFVYLIFSLAVFYLYKLWNKEYKLNPILVILILCAIIATKSGSGVVGFGISIGLIIIYNLKVKNSIMLILISALIGYLIYLLVVFTPRLLLYYNDLAILYDCLNTECFMVKGVWSGQMVNIIPVWERWIEIKELNIFPTILGTGNGSASVANNGYNNLGNVSNPHANIIRLFYDNGLIGLILFSIAFITPIKKAMYKCMSLNSKNINIFLLLYLGVLGSFMSHRSPTLFILFGISMIVFLLKSDVNNKGA